MSQTNDQLTALIRPPLAAAFAAGEGQYPGTLHHHFGYSVKEFADRSGLVRKRTRHADGKLVWHGWAALQRAVVPTALIVLDIAERRFEKRAGR